MGSSRLDGYSDNMLDIKEDRAEVTLGILMKIPPNLLLDLSPITLGRLKMFSNFIFLCLQNMVSGQQVRYINLPHPSHPQDLHIGQDLKKSKVDRNRTLNLLLSILVFFMLFTIDPTIF